MKLLRALTVFALVSSLFVPATPASASHYGYQWLQDGRLDGTLVVNEAMDAANPEEPDSELDYTINFPSQEITFLDFSWVQVSPYWWQDDLDNWHACTRREEIHETGTAQHAYFPTDFVSDGHAYYISMDPIVFPVHRTETLSGDCDEGMAGTTEGDYVHRTFNSYSAGCNDDLNEPAACMTDDPYRLVGTDVLDLSGSDTVKLEASLSWDVTWTPPEECAPKGTVSPSDSDGDRLPNAYETNVLGTDAYLTDSDLDCYGDALELASGSAPDNGVETPDTLSPGTDPLLLQGSGDSGVTCGRTKFKWVTPAAQSLRVAADKPGCIFLYSNNIANAVADYAIKYGPDITTTLEKMTAPYLSEIYGDESVDWVKDKKVDAAVWGASKRYLKKGMRAGLNMTRLNAIFTAGKVAGLNAIALGGVWKLNQIRNNDACIQVRIGTTSGGSTKMSWSLVYSADQVTDPKLSVAGTWKKKDGVIDQAVRAPINLSCSQGAVTADGDGARKVFSEAVSEIF